VLARYRAIEEVAGVELQAGLVGQELHRPAGRRVPDVLLSGHHAEVRRWRRKAALARTLERRPELLERAPLDDEERAMLEEMKRALLDEIKKETES